MKVVSSPRNRSAGLSRSRALRRSDQPGQGWRQFIGSFGRGVWSRFALFPLWGSVSGWPVTLWPPEQVALRTSPGLARQIRAGNTRTTPLWAPLSLLVVLAGLWYGVQRTVSFPFMDDGPQTTLIAVARTVGGVSPADGVGVATHPEDHLTPGQIVPPSPELDAPLVSAQTIRISGKDFVVSVRTHALTVQQALAEAGITLGPLDRIEPALTDPVTEAAGIRVIRVRQYKEDQQEVVPFEVRRVDDPNLPLGLRRQVQYGSPGTLLRRIETFTEDGQVVSRRIAEDRMLTMPRADVVAFGIRRLSGPTASLEVATRLVPGYGGMTSDTLAFSHVLRVVATGYEAGPQSTGKERGDRWYGITSTGQRAVPGIIAVDPDIIPYGTRLYVPDYGFGVAGDTGGAIVGRRIDLFYNTEQEALQWGRRTLPVYILE